MDRRADGDHADLLHPHANAALIVATFLVIAAPASADELRVMSAGGTAAAHLALVSRFDRATGHKVVTTATSAGVGREAILTRVRGGEPVDVLLLANFAMDEMIRRGQSRGGEPCRHRAVEHRHRRSQGCAEAGYQFG
jgi:hypothetical protein